MLEILGAMFGWLREIFDAVTGIRRVWWQRKLQARMRTTADSITEFLAEWKANTPLDREGRIDWPAKTSSAFRERFYEVLTELQSELDAWEISDRELYRGQRVRYRSDMKAISDRLRVLAARRKLLR